MLIDRCLPLQFKFEAMGIARAGKRFPVPANYTHLLPWTCLNQKRNTAAWQSVSNSRLSVLQILGKRHGTAPIFLLFRLRSRQRSLSWGVRLMMGSGLLSQCI